jgi:hypothetical protein
MVASGVQIVVRTRGDRLVEHPLVPAAMAQQPVARVTTRESQVTDAVFALPQLLLEDGVTSARLLVTRRAWQRGAPISVGQGLADGVDEHLVTTVPCDGFLATAVLDRSQGRGACEGTLADEDRAGDSDRWCSLTACGQEVWHIVWHWVWNLRLAFSAGSAQAPLRAMEGAPPHPQTGATQASAEPAPDEAPADGPLDGARVRGGRLGAEALALQDDGTLRCPQGIERDRAVAVPVPPSERLSPAADCHGPRC